MLLKKSDERLCLLQEPFKLKLRNFSTAEEPQRSDVTLSFAHALLPHVATDASYVYAVTAGGFLHSIQLPQGQPTAVGSGHQPLAVSSAFLDLRAGMSQQQVAEWKPVSVLAKAGPYD